MKRTTEWLCRCLCLLLLTLAVGCGEASESDAQDQATTRAKQQAAASAGRADQADLCSENGWYGDGFCDTFCPDPDPDCEPYNPCANNACGETCTLCAPDDPNCVETAVVKYCQADGSCAGTTPECSDPDETYEPCAEKSCGESCTVCPPDDPNCVETAVVKYCQADGSCGGTTPECADPSDPEEPYEPCAEKSCGETCTVCPPGDPNCAETAVVKYCQADGSCDSTEPTCEQPSGECVTDADCVVTGCSGQVCAPQHVFTTCEWRKEYACYQKHGSCGCNDGVCGWAETDELAQCLND